METRAAAAVVRTPAVYCYCLAVAEPAAKTSPPSAVKNRRVTLGRILALSRPEWRRITGATVALAVAAAMNLTFPAVFRQIVDDALKKVDLAQINRVAIALVIVFAIGAVASAIRYYLFSTAGERIVTRLRERLYRSLVHQEIGFFDGERTGELLNRLASDTGILQSAVSANLSMLLRHTVTALGGITMLFVTSPILTALMLCVVPPVAIGAVIYGRRVRKLSKEVQDALAVSAEVAEETLSGIRTVRSFAAEEIEAARYTAGIEKAYDLARRRIRAGAAFISIAFFLVTTSGVAVLWYGARMLSDGSMTVGALLSFLLYSIFVGGSLGALSELWADFMRSLGAAERIFELIDREPRIPSSGGRTLEKVSGSVAFQDVRFAYPTRVDVPVLDRVTLAISPGERVAVVGPSGAGKSTIAALLARFYDPIGGAIRIDGVDLRELDPNWLHRQVGTVAQEPILFSSTIAENIRYGRPGASNADVEAAARVANAHEFVGRFPLAFETLVGERGIQLSGGQKQRVAIARAVLKDPRILVLDEATSALDAESEHLVKEALDRLMRGRTTLIIAHRLSTVRDADRVLVLEGGKIVQTGTHAALVAEDGLYRKLVERQFV